MFPAEFVEARRVKAPLEEREKMVEVVGSNDTEELRKRSRPENAPASPTFPIRLKSTCGRAAKTTLEARQSKKRKGKAMLMLGCKE
jgi:hypothetical protein